MVYLIFSGIQHFYTYICISKTLVRTIWKHSNFLVKKESEFAGMGNTWYFLSKSLDIPVFPAGMGNTHKCQYFALIGTRKTITCVTCYKRRCSMY